MKKRLIGGDTPCHFPVVFAVKPGEIGGLALLNGIRAMGRVFIQHPYATVDEVSDWYRDYTGLVLDPDTGEPLFLDLSPLDEGASQEGGDHGDAEDGDTVAVWCNRHFGPQALPTVVLPLSEKGRQRMAVIGTVLRCEVARYAALLGMRVEPLEAANDNRPPARRNSSPCPECGKPRVVEG